MKYPETRTVPHTDTYHGQEVPDPHRWLEDDIRLNKEVAAWVAAQSTVTQGYVEGIEAREPLRARLRTFWN